MEKSLESAQLHTRLDQSVAVVTGATGAIGGAICDVLAREGAAVVATGRNVAALDRVVERLRGAGGRASAFAADVTRADEMERLAEHAERELGPVDILALVAGGGGEPVALADLAPARWRETLDLNLTSAFFGLRAFLPHMAKRGRGKVVVISSLAGEHVVPQARLAASPAYAAAKAGLLVLARQAAREYAPQGVRINAIAPGTVENARIGALPDSVRQKLASSHPVGRIGQPADIAEAALYLLSDASAWITGATLDINGGSAMG